MYLDLATKLAEKPTTSTNSMDLLDRQSGIEQMLEDLHQLATADGCIAAAWALEYLKENV